MQRNHITSQRSDRQLRTGFTLIELLIVIGLLVTLVTLTVLSVDFTVDSQRVTGASRQLQGFIAGARDRALRAREVRGVRLVVASPPTMFDSDGNRVVNEETTGRIATSAYYIKQLRWVSSKEDAADAVLLIRYADSTGTHRSLVMHNDGLMWRILRLKRAMPSSASATDYNMRIRFGEDPRWTAARWINDNEWNEFTNFLQNLADEYKVSLPPQVLNNPGQFRGQTLQLATISPMIEAPSLPTQPRIARQFSAYELDLPPTVVPNEEPLILPENLCIDLDASRVPTTWRPPVGEPTNSMYSQRMDILFSPTGAMTGASTVDGWIHLCVAERAEVDALAAVDEQTQQPRRAPVNFSLSNTPRMPSDDLRETLVEEGLTVDRRIVSISPGTGRVITTTPDTTRNPNATNFAESPFLYAEQGK